MGIPCTNEEFLRKLKDRGVKYIPLEKYVNTHTKIEWQCFNNEKHTFTLSPCNIYKDIPHCPYCERKRVFVGETDLWTERPDVAIMLLNPEDGYKYMSTSSKKLDWKCPRCGCVIEDKVINNVSMYGLSCPHCSDNISFSEKFVRNLLIQLKCDFSHDRTISWSDNRRYDFYIPAINLIIETHGIQHYSRSFKGLHYCIDARSCEEEQANDIYKKELALSNGIKHYVELDCRYSDCDYIKNSILNSELSKIFDLSIIDWQECFKSTITSDVVTCANLWNEIKDTRVISEKTGIHISSVISHLKKAAKTGLCDYTPNYNKNKRKQNAIDSIIKLWNDGVRNSKDLSVSTGYSHSYIYILLNECRKQGFSMNMTRNNIGKKVLCVETGKIYETIASVEKDGYSASCVSNVCNGRTKHHQNLHFKFI